MPINPKTTPNSRPPVDNPVDDKPACDSANGANKRGATSPDDQGVFHRLFLYLQTLNVPEEKARELAREALKIAGSTLKRDTAGKTTFISEAMRALRKLLTQQLPRLRKEPFSQGGVFFFENSERLNSMPPLNRGFMVSNKIDLIPWRTFFLRSLKKAAAVIPRPLYFLIFFISLIILLFVVLSLGK